jgi:restriction endonuclease S subunit
MIKFYVTQRSLFLNDLKRPNRMQTPKNNNNNNNINNNRMLTIAAETQEPSSLKKKKNTPPKAQQCWANYQNTHAKITHIIHYALSSIARQPVQSTIVPSGTCLVKI